MTTKRILLMLLVMLFGLKGAWSQQVKVNVEFDPSNSTISYSASLVGASGYSGPNYSSGHEILLQSLDRTTTYETITETNKVWKVNGTYADTNYNLKIGAGTFVWRNIDDFEHPFYSPELNVTLHICYRNEYDADGFCVHCKSLQIPEKVDGAYQIANKGNLMWYNLHPDASARLTADIVLNSSIFNSDGTPKKPENISYKWSPIELKNKTFDGNGHSISGVYVSEDTSPVGFFSHVDNSTIKNLTIKNSYVCQTSRVSPSEGLLFVGGIAGVAERSTFIGCHNAAVVEVMVNRNDIGGICGGADADVSFISCMNTGKVIEPQNDAYGISRLGQSINCVCLAGTASYASRFVTSDEIRNGTAAFYLNAGVTDGSQSWYQKLGTDSEPHNTTKGGDTLYGGFKHLATSATLTNTESRTLHLNPFDASAETEEGGNHGVSMVSGVCTVCGLECSHPAYTEGHCNTCNYQCPHHAHETTEDGFSDYCTICSMDMTNYYMAAPQAADGFYEVSLPSHLYWMIGKVAKNSEISFRLMKDITINKQLLNADGTLRAAAGSRRTWDGISYFQGTFDGCGHVISGLYGKPLFLNLFGATIRNVGIVDSYADSEADHGSFANFFNNSTMLNSYSQGTVAGTGVAVAGLVGQSNSGIFRNCYYAGKVNGPALCHYTIASEVYDFSSTINEVYRTNISDLPEGATILTNCKHYTAKEFASGMVAYEMNQNLSDGERQWFQTIGTEKAPSLLPTGSNIVYRLTNCLEEYVYRNVNHLDAGNHLIDREQHLCVYCGKGEKPHRALDGYYEISLLGHLAWFRDYAVEHTNVNARLVKDITMNADIKAENLYEWIPIKENYSGTFDGNGHVIRGLYGDGLFDGLNGGTVKHLGIEDSRVISPMFGYNVSNGSHIIGCYMKDAENLSTRREMVASLHGNSTIENSFVFNKVSGFIVGQTLATNSYVKNCAVLAGNGSAIARDAQPENIQNSGVYSEDNFREGTVAWLLNAGNTDGTQMFYQTLGKDKMPVFTNTGHNTVYGFYNDQGVFVYENGPDYHGHFGTANGTEFVCKYCGQTLPGELDTHDYLEFTAVGGSVTIGMKKTGSPDNYSLQYSADKSAWTTVELSATTDGIVTIPLGGKCYFRNGAETVVNNISKNQTNHWSFTMTGEGTVKADGNIMSLLDASCEKNTMSDWPQHVFTGLFKGCAKLTVAPKLPATKLGQFCYMYMFEGTGIKDAPELPATTIPDGAYNGMFRNCKSLENVSPLPGTSLSRRAYNEMFAGCENLTSVEIANITSMDSRDDSSNASFYNWLEGTASGGKLMAPIEMMGNALVFLPADWQWATRLSANEDPEHKGNFYTTFCDSRYDYAVVDGFKAYSGIIASGSNGDELRLTAIPGNIIAKGDGVVIHGGSDQVLLTLSNGSSERVEGNVLTGSDTDIMAPANCYIMSYGQNGIGFYKYAEDNILAAHKAYLVYNMPAGAKDLRMVFIEGVVNGIDDSLLSPLMGDDAIYNLNGARMPQLRKGVNIVKQADGKTRKVVVK